jgi:hypothetical protein
VEEDFPAWCRLTGNELVSLVRRGKERSFLVCKGTLAERGVVAVSIPRELPAPAPAPTIPPLAVMGIGSWPRPRWMLQAIHEHLEGRLSDAEFQTTADDAVRLAVQAQLRAGVASFVLSTAGGECDSSEESTIHELGATCSAEEPGGPLGVVPGGEEAGGLELFHEVFRALRVDVHLDGECVGEDRFPARLGKQP